MVITKLHVKNFRCFKDFILNDITPVTLISGKNNAGKSTLLESIFLLFDYQTPTVFFKLNSFRGNLFANIFPKFLWEHLFYTMDTSNELLVSITFNNKERVLRLQRDNKTNVSTVDLNKPNEIAAPSRRIIESYYPLSISYQEGDYNEAGRCNIVFPNVTIDFKSPPKPITTGVQYFGPNVRENPNKVAEWFGELEISGGKKRLVETLKQMESKIDDLFTVISDGVGYIYANTVSNVKMPLFAMGEGMKNLMMIALYMLINPNSIVLIDEVENGFHHSFHEYFWKFIFSLSKDTNCQIFATTHSYECIRAAVNAAASENVDRFSYVRLGEKKGDVFPHIFSKEPLIYAVESELEVR